VLILRVVIEHILLDFVTFLAQSIFFVKILEVVSNDSVGEVSIGVATQEKREHYFNRSNDATDVSEQVEDGVDSAGDDDFLVI